MSDAPTEERITFLLDVLDEIAGTDFVAHLQNAEIKHQLIADLARDTGIPGIFCKALFWGFERLLAGVAEHGVQWLKTRFGQPTAYLIVRIPGSNRAIDWLRRYARRLRDDADLRRYLERVASGEVLASVAALPASTRADTRLLVRVLEETQLLQEAETTGLSEATKLPPLPRRRTFFVGRDAEKRQLMERLAGGGRAAICAVAGMGGVGKTELALQVAGALGEAGFPEGIVTVNLMGTPDAATSLPPLAPEAAMRDVLAQLDPTAQPPAEPAALARAYAQALVGKRLLLVLDNARDTAQVTPLVPPEPVALVVTSRHRIDLAESLTLDLDTLRPEDALTLLREEIGAARALDEPTLTRFAALCDYLPVALLVIAGTIKNCRTRTPAQLLDRLEADRTKGLTGVLHRLRPSVDVLTEDDPDLARRFARLAVFAGDFSIKAAAHVFATDEDGACDSIDALLDRSLLLTGAAGTADAPRFRLHDLIRELAAERLGDDGQEARSRHATYFRDLLARCDQCYLVGNDALLEGLALFDRERAEITAAHAWAAAQAPVDGAAARLAADYPNAGIYVIVLRLDSRTRVLWLQAALDACRRLGDRGREGSALGNLGLAWADLGEPRKAIAFYEQALTICRETGDRLGEGSTLGNLGSAWAALDEPSQAIACYEQRLTVAREIDDSRGEGNALGNLGLTWDALGESRQAIDFYEQQLVITQEIGDRRGEGNALWNAALAHETLNEPEQALEKAKTGFVIRRAIDDPNVAKVAAWLRERGVDPDTL